MFEFNVNNDIIIYIIKEVTVEKVAAHLCLTLIINKLKTSVE